MLILNAQAFVLTTLCVLGIINGAWSLTQMPTSGDTVDWFTTVISPSTTHITSTSSTAPTTTPPTPPPTTTDFGNVTQAPFCSPGSITMNISSDLPAYSDSKIDVNCSRPLYEFDFSLNTDNFDMFSIIRTASGVNLRNNVVLKENDMSKDLEIQMLVTPRVDQPLVVYLRLHVVEINDPPIIQNISTVLQEGRELVISGYSHKITVTDPDAGQDGGWGNVKITSPDLPEQFVIQQNNGWNLLLVKPLDADIFSNDGFNDWEEPAAQLEGPEDMIPIDIPRSEIPRRNPNLIPGPPRIRFHLVATDGGNLSSTATVVINIRDINDNSPVCNSPGAIHTDPSKGKGLNILSYCSDADYSIRYRHSLGMSRILSPMECPNVFSLTEGMLVDPRFLPENTKKCKVSLVVSDPDFATILTFDVMFDRCPAGYDKLGQYWNETSPGTSARTNCPDGYKGYVERFCDINATFREPVYNCLKFAIDRIREKIMQSNGPIQKNLIEELANETSAEEASYNYDVEVVIYVLQEVNNRLDRDAVNSTDIAESYIDVANNLIKSANSRTWESLISRGRYGADVVLQNVDAFAEKLILASNDSVSEYTRSNMYVKVGSGLNCSTSIGFPNKSSSTIPLWAKGTSDYIDVPCHENYSSFSSVIYKNMSEMLQRTLLENSSFTRDRKVNSPVISLTLFPETGEPLSAPATVTLEVFDKELESPVCSFWVFGNRKRPGRGFWSTEGCVLESYNRRSGVVVCKCNHLTNFAILMSPSGAVSAADHLALSVITIIGCVISCICLVATVAIHAFFYRSVKSDRTTILLNLCVVLFIAYVVFLAGVSRTDNKGVCTAISMLLHFLYLTVFFLMLAEGVDLGYRAYSSTTKYPLGRYFTVGAYVGSAVIVGISAGATQMHGYGNSRSCWLSVDSGLIWAFIAPALLVIVVNTVIAVGVLKQMFGLSAIKDKTRAEKAKTGARGVLVMLPVMGLAWVFGVFSVSQSTVVFQYLFALFNSLQGGLLFVFHCLLNKKIQDSFKAARSRSLQQDSESGGKVTSKRTETSQI